MLYERLLQGLGIKKMFKLLIVDDEKRTREGIKSSIHWKSFGISLIEEADDGDTALEVAFKFMPDIILSDIRMPRMTGIEFASIIRKELPKCKLIFLSGYSDKEYLKSAIALNAVSYVEKPINVQELKEVLRNALDLCISELKESNFKNETSIKLEASIPIIRQQLALYLTEGRVNMNKIEEMLSLCDIELPLNGRYLTVLYKLNPPTDKNSIINQEDLSQSLLKAIDEVYLEDNIKYLACVKEGTTVLSHVLLSSEFNLHDTKSSSEKVKSRFREHLATVQYNSNLLFTGIGLEANGIGNLFTSYQTAFLAVQRVFFLGNTSTVIYDDKFQNPYIYDKFLIDKFSEYLLNFDIHGMNEFIENTTKEIIKHNTTLIDNVKALFYNFLVKLYDCMRAKDLNSTNINEQNEFLWQIVSNCLTLSELKEYFIERVNDYFYKINSKSGTNRVAFEIISYIQKNYSNRSLPISLISDSLNLTPAYLCQVFKKETGKTINDYLNEYRIEKSKELLKNRGVKLYEVSHNSGYNDVKYFTKTFKKFTGITPSEYRENVMK
jgi:two-component system, response regulator YesN